MSPDINSVPPSPGIPTDDGELPEELAPLISRALAVFAEISGLRYATDTECWFIAVDSGGRVCLVENAHVWAPIPGELLAEMLVIPWCAAALKLDAHKRERQRQEEARFDDVPEEAVQALTHKADAKIMRYLNAANAARRLGL